MIEQGVHFHDIVDRILQTERNDHIGLTAVRQRIPGTPEQVPGSIEVEVQSYD